MQCLYRDDEVTFYIGFMFCVVYCMFRQLFEVECFRVFPCRDIPRQSFRKRKKKRTDTLVLVL